MAIRLTAHWLDSLLTHVIIISLCALPLNKTVFTHKNNHKVGNICLSPLGARWKRSSWWATTIANLSRTQADLNNLLFGDFVEDTEPPASRMEPRCGNHWSRSLVLPSWTPFPSRCVCLPAGPRPGGNAPSHELNQGGLYQLEPPVEGGPGRANATRSRDVAAAFGQAQNRAVRKSVLKHRPR